MAKEECFFCDGSGKHPVCPDLKCSECGGKGTVNMVKCPDCKGTKKIDDHDCYRCFGKGKVPATLARRLKYFNMVKNPNRWKDPIHKTVQLKETEVGYVDDAVIFFCGAGVDFEKKGPDKYLVTGPGYVCD